MDEWSRSLVLLTFPSRWQHFLRKMIATKHQSEKRGGIMSMTSCVWFDAQFVFKPPTVYQKGNGFLFTVWIGVYRCHQPAPLQFIYLSRNVSVFFYYFFFLKESVSVSSPAHLYLYIQLEKDMARWILGHILLVPNKCLLNLQRFAGLYSDIWAMFGCGVKLFWWERNDALTIN